MPKTVSPGLDAARARGTTTLALCVKATRVESDGEVFAFTSWPLPIVIAGQRYEPGFNRTSIVTSANLTVDNLEIMGAMESAGITDDDILAGKWDGCEVEYFELNPLNITDGIMSRKRGWIGEVRSGRLAFVAELHGLLRKLQQEIGRLFTPGCPWTYGDADTCGVRLDPPVWTASTAYSVRQARDARTGSVIKPTVQNRRNYQCQTAGTSGATEPSWNTLVAGTTNDGSVVWTTIEARTYRLTVTSVSDRVTFFDSAGGGDFPDDYFSDGTLRWLTGLNAGTPVQFVKRHQNVGGRFDLRRAMYFAIQVGDTADVTKGCYKRRDEDCRIKDDNVDNFGAYPDLTGIDQVTTQGIV